MQGNPHVDPVSKRPTPLSNSSNSKPLPPPVTGPRPKNRKIIRGPVSTSTKQATGYITVKGIESETSLQEREWPIFAEQQLIENSYDFLNTCYPKADKKDRKIAVSVNIDQSESIAILRVVTRNSNIDNVPVFEELHEVFDFNTWYSSKRNQHRISTGALGDALKRIIGMGYASWTSNDNPEDWFEDRQWTQPVILRFNNQEHKVIIHVEKENVVITPIFEGPVAYNAPDFTEVEASLPITGYWHGRGYEALLDTLEQYYKRQKLVKSRIEFSFTKGVV